MNAFFSGTDDANENMTQFYAVWGKVEDNEPAFAFRYVVGNTKEECDPGMLIDWPKIDRVTETKVTEKLTFHGDISLMDVEVEETELVKENKPELVEEKNKRVNGPFKMIPYPEDWMGQHSKKKYAYSKTNSKYYNKDNVAKSYYDDFYSKRFNSDWGKPAYPQNNYQTSLDIGYDDSLYPMDSMDPFFEPSDDLNFAGQEVYDLGFSANTYDGVEVSDGLKDFLRDFVKKMIKEEADIKDMEW